MIEQLRSSTGKFVSKDCPDPDCCGQMIRDTDRDGNPVIRCDGLTINSADNLVACDHEVEAISRKEPAT